MALSLLTGVLILLWAGTPSSAVEVSLTSEAGEILCDGSEATFTCETRGSDTLEWSSNNSYVQEPIGFAAVLHPINTTRLSPSNPSTVAILTQNYLNGDVRVLVSTLRITPLLAAPNATIFCVIAGSNTVSHSFQVIAPPVIPQILTTFQIHQINHMCNMCAIASVLQSPSNVSEADATVYIVYVDGASVLYSIADGVLVQQPTLVYGSTCGAHRISISASNMCGQSPGTQEVMLDPEQHIVLSTATVAIAGASSESDIKYGAVFIGGVVLVAFICV